MTVALLILSGIFFAVQKQQASETVYVPLGNLQGMFRVEHGQFIGNDDQTVRVLGVNLGQWLVREGYLWELGPHRGQDYEINYAEHVLRDMLSSVLRDAPYTVDEFLSNYQEVFITEDDVQYLAALGVNLVRIPFAAHSFQKSMLAGEAVDTEFAYLDRALGWCERYQIYCLFDLHAAFAPQSTLPHADSRGEATFWNDARAQEQTQVLWEIIARRYQDEPWLAGFDLLNEPQAPSDEGLSRWYAQTIQRIRETGNTHTLFIQPNNISLDIAAVVQHDDNIAYIPHFYGFGVRAAEENKILFDQKKEHGVAVAIGEVGNWANDWWAEHTDKYVLYRYLQQDIPIVYWNYKDMIADTQGSFGIVSGNTGGVYQQFKTALEQGTPLPADFPYDTLFEQFRTVVPTNRPLVEQIIRDVQPGGVMEVPEEFDISGSRWYRRTSASTTSQTRPNPYADSFKHCNGLTVATCFGWE